MAKYRITPSSKAIVQSPISIGHKAEKGVEAIEFDLTAWVETYGSGTLTVIMRRWGDAIPYPIALEIDENNKATWTLSDTDTAKAGMAYAQLSYIVGDEVVKKSDIYTFRVMDSLTGEGDPPEAYESWLENLTHLAAEAMAEVLDIEGIVTDKTLTIDGGIADAKATGDALGALEDQFTEETDKLKADLGVIDSSIGEPYEYIEDVEYTIINGKKFNNRGAGNTMKFGDNTTYNYILLSVEQGEKYNIKTYFTSADTYYIYMCDSEGIIVNRSHNANGISGSQTFDVEIPANVAQLYIQGYSSAAAIINRMDVKKYGLYSIRYVLDSASEKIEETKSIISMLRLNNYTLVDARVEIGQMSILGPVDNTVTNRMHTRIFPLYCPTLVGAGEFSFAINQYKAYNYSSSQIIKNWVTTAHGNEKVLVYGDSYPIYIMLAGKNADDSDITQQDMSDFASAITLEGLEPDVMYASIAMFNKFALTGCSWDAGTVYQSSDGHVTHTGVGWGEILGRRNGCTVGNFAIGGSNLRSWFNYEGHSNGFPALLQAEAYPLYILTEGNSNDANAFVVNDENYSASVPSTTTYYVGTIEDISTRQDYHDYPCTFYGYYGRVIEMIQEHAPNARIVISSPDTTAITTDIRKALRTACKNIATYYGLPYMDIEKDPYYDIYVNTLVGYHPSAPTYSGWAMAIERQFAECVKNNLPYFQLYSGRAITPVEVEWEAVSLE